MKKLFILLGALAVAPAFAQGIVVNFGQGGADTGYDVHSETMAGGARRVDAYDWVCPWGSSRPADGLVVIFQSEADDTGTRIQLGARQCYDYDTDQVVDMVKQYRQGYYVVGGKAGELGGVPEGAGEAAAAKAAGAAAGGYFNPCTPNPFALCSMGEPSADDPMHACWDAVCPHGR